MIHKNSIKALQDYAKKRRLNLKDKRFGRLFGVCFYKIVNRRSYWLFDCDCGKRIIRSGRDVNMARTRSCGCLRIENTAKMNSTHKMSKERFYKIWHGILKRCNNKKHKSYHIYGGKGIKCFWKSFEEFKQEMYDSYLIHIKKFGEKNTTIDRINNDKGYFKKNCKWATKKEQTRNIKTNRFITYNGQKKILADWSEELGIGHSTIINRLNHGWSVKKALSIKPKRGSNQYTI